MDVLDKKSDKELLESLVKEAAKAQNEVACARRDLEKATARMRFVLMLANTMIDRSKD
jgi:hypothetical protein